MQPPCISFQIHRAYQLRAYIRVLKLPPLRLHALRLNLIFLLSACHVQEDGVQIGYNLVH